jgi:hypothetical protein
MFTWLAQTWAWWYALPFLITLTLSTIETLYGIRQDFVRRRVKSSYFPRITYGIVLRRVLCGFIPAINIGCAVYFILRAFEAVADAFAATFNMPVVPEVKKETL